MRNEQYVKCRGRAFTKMYIYTRPSEYMCIYVLTSSPRRNILPSKHHACRLSRRVPISPSDPRWVTAPLLVPQPWCIAGQFPTNTTQAARTPSPAMRQRGTMIGLRNCAGQPGTT